MKAKAHGPLILLLPEVVQALQQSLINLGRDAGLHSQVNEQGEHHCSRLPKMIRRPVVTLFGFFYS